MGRTWRPPFAKLGCAPTWALRGDVPVTPVTSPLRCTHRRPGQAIEACSVLACRCRHTSRGYHLDLRPLCRIASGRCARSGAWRLCAVSTALPHRPASQSGVGPLRATPPAHAATSGGHQRREGLLRARRPPYPGRLQPGHRGYGIVLGRAVGSRLGESAVCPRHGDPSRPACGPALCAVPLPLNAEVESHAATGSGCRLAGAAGLGSQSSSVHGRRFVRHASESAGRYT